MEAASHDIVASWAAMMLLAESEDPKVRWQIGVAAKAKGSEAIEFLECMLNDQDGYCRRRAALTLVELQPERSAKMWLRLANDSDAYNRWIGRNQILKSDDAASGKPDR